MENQSKHCTQCGIDKPMTEYYSHPGHKDGKQSHCKHCQYERKRVYNEKLMANEDLRSEVRKREWANQRMRIKLRANALR